MADKGEGSTSAVDQLQQLSRESVFEILLRLSAPDVYRCRLVSHEWEAVAKDQDFVARHRSIRSPMPLFMYRGDIETLRVHGVRVYPTQLNAVDLATGESRRLLSSADVVHAKPYDLTPEEEYQQVEEEEQFTMLQVGNQMFKVHGTSDGILLLSMSNQLVAYNPFTRRWGRLPPLHQVKLGCKEDIGILAFYASGTLGEESRENRILYQIIGTAGASYRILILGGPDHEIVNLTAAGMSPQLTSHLQGGLHVEPYMTPPIMYGDCLYWLPLEENLGSNGRKIVAFDTKAEHFIWIGTPSIFYDLWAPIQLLTIQGELAMAVTNLSDPEVNHGVWPQSVINIWVLKDHVGESWNLSYTIAQPPQNVISNGYVRDIYPPVFLVPEAQGVLLPCLRVLVQCDCNWSVLSRRRRELDYVIGLPHQIEENFMLHTFLDRVAEVLPFDFHDTMESEDENEDDNSEEEDDDNDDDAESGGSHDFSGGGGEDDFSGNEDGNSEEDNENDGIHSSQNENVGSGRDSEVADEDEEQPPSKRQK